MFHFVSCGIALYVGGVVKDANGLFYSSPSELQEMGVNMKMKYEVTNIDTDGKKIAVRNLETNEEFEDTFDKLVMTTGSWPIIPNLEGIDLNNVVLS